MPGLSEGSRDSQPSPARMLPSETNAVIMAGGLQGKSFLARWGALPWAAGNLREKGSKGQPPF